eukprot:NODE_1009_length_2251_cov_0.242565.p1 type:complete len:251 gc:universal NODE_1009_length_2251_cov_0.242565:2124-1372(-)
MQCIVDGSAALQLNAISHDLPNRSLCVGLKLLDFKSFYNCLYQLFFLKEFGEMNYKNSIDIQVLDPQKNNDCISNYRLMDKPLIPLPIPELQVIPSANLNFKSVTHIALGGTFDHMHSGHYLLLYTAAFLSRKITCGVVEFPKKNQQHLIRTIKDRSTDVSRILSCFNSIVQILPINDPYGPTTSNPDISAVLASTETKSNALKINEIRVANNLSSLQIVLVDTIPDLKMGGKLSSSKIRDDLAKISHKQ